MPSSPGAQLVLLSQGDLIRRGGTGRGDQVLASARHPRPQCRIQHAGCLHYLHFISPVRLCTLATTFRYVGRFCSIMKRYKVDPRPDRAIQRGQSESSVDGSSHQPLLRTAHPSTTSHGGGRLMDKILAFCPEIRARLPALPSVPFSPLSYLKTHKHTPAPACVYFMNGMQLAVCCLFRHSPLAMTLELSSSACYSSLRAVFRLSKEGPSHPHSSPQGVDCFGGLSVRVGSAALGQRKARSDVCVT